MQTINHHLSGANMDIDLTTPEAQVEWKQDSCPWNQFENSKQHKCAVKNVSICPYFSGIEYLDVVQCSYPVDQPSEIPDLKINIVGPSLGKANLCEPVLRALPDWFGLEESNQHYLEAIDQMPTFLALDQNFVVGFLTMKQHYPKAVEVYVTGVLPQFHRRGIGCALLIAAEKHLCERDVEYLQVKTLSESHPDEGYVKTRAFYLAMGFLPLEEFKTLWDENNPALLLVKKI